MIADQVSVLSKN